MSYSIQEGVQDAEKRVQAERAIAERFPDAYLSERNCWVSPSAVEHVTDIEIVAVSVEKGAVVYTYLMVEGMRVYAPLNQGGVAHHLVFLHKLKEERPEAYKALVDVAAGRKP